MADESVTSPSACAPAQDANRLSLLDLAIVLAKRKALIVAISALAGVVAGIVALVVPETYTARTRLLPPQQSQSATAAMLGQLGAIAGAAGSLGLRNPSELYVSMLKSRTLSDRLIERYDLQHVFQLQKVSEARTRLESNTKISSGKDGLITIEYEDIDPARSAAIANAYVEELMSLTSRLAITEASQRRLFFELQLEQAKDRLLNAEVAAKNALERGGLAVVDAQGRAMVEVAAMLRAQVSAKETEISSIRSFAGDHNPTLRKAETELLALRQQLSKTESGSGVAKKNNAHVSNSSLKNVALLRDMKYAEYLFELIGRQYELAKIDEAKDYVAIQVLDRAIVPDGRTHPRRTLIVLMSIFGGFFVSVLVAIAMEAIDNARRNPYTKGRLERLLAYLRVSSHGAARKD